MDKASKPRKAKRAKKVKRAGGIIEKTYKAISITDLDILESEPFFRAYANFVRGVNSPYDITLFFGQIDQPLAPAADAPRMLMKGSVTMSVTVAERLVALLLTQIADFKPPPPTANITEIGK